MSKQTNECNEEICHCNQHCVFCIKLCTSYSSQQSQQKFTDTYPVYCNVHSSVNCSVASSHLKQILYQMMVAYRNGKNTVTLLQLQKSIAHLKSLVEKWDQQNIKWELDMQNNQHEPQGQLDVCPEVWTCDHVKNRKDCKHEGRRYYEDCGGLQVKKIEKVLTFLLVITEQADIHRMSQLIHGIKKTKYQSVNTVVVVTKNELKKMAVQKCRTNNKSHYHPSSKFISAWNGNKYGSQKMLFSLKDPQKVLAPIFSWSSDITDIKHDFRHHQVKTHTNNRQSNGYWHIGCYQARVKNYTYHVYDGYDLSYNSCLYCDYLSGPFAARTALLKSVISKNLDGETVYADIWLKFRDKFKTLACPDVMFETTSITIDTGHRSFWMKLAKKCQFSIIKLPGKTLTFTCQETSTNCKPKKGLILPVCCYKMLSQGLVDSVKQLDAHNIHYELAAGTALGALKFGATLPWEIDHDIHVLSANISGTEAIKAVKTRLEALGYRVSGKILNLNQCMAKVKFPNRTHCGEHYVHIANFDTAFWGFTRLTSDLWDKSKQPTRINVNGYWMRVKPNPELYARNFFGDDIFEHVEHFHLIRIPYNTPYEAGKAFSQCPTSGFHGCLNGNYLPFGSTQFGEI